MLRPLVLFFSILVFETISSLYFETSFINKHSKDKPSSESLSKLALNERFRKDIRQERLSLKTERHLRNNFEYRGQRKYTTFADVKKNGQLLFRQRRATSSLSLEFPLVCHEKFSCRNKCLNPRKAAYNDTLSCYCDIDCEFFKDCCADFRDVCKAERARSTAFNFTLGISKDNTSNLTISVNNLNKLTHIHKRKWSCFPLKRMIERAEGIWMIGSCPDSWPKNDIFNRCRNLSAANTIVKDNYHYLPVYTSDGTVYHNRFCAQCNSEDMGKTKPYDLIFATSCSISSNGIGSNCTVEGWQPAQGQPRRYCMEIMSMCLSPFKQERCENETVGIVNDDRHIFKNIHCAKCFSGLKNLRCGPNMTGFTGSNIASQTPSQMPTVLQKTPSPMPTVLQKTPFTILPPATADLNLPKPFDDIFNIHSRAPATTSTPIRMTCAPGKVFDRYSQVCRETLTVVQTNQEPPYKGEVIAQYEIVLLLSNLSNCYRYIENASLDVEIASLFGVSKLQIIGTNFDNRSWTLWFHLRMKESESLFTSSILQKISNFTLPFNISIADGWFTVMNSTSKKIQCSSLQTYNSSQYASSKDGSSIIINKTGEVIKIKDFYTNGTSLNDSQSVIVCRHLRSLNCSFKWVSLGDKEFLVLENRSILVNNSKKLYDPLRYLWQNETLYICENFSSSFQVRISRFVRKNNFALSMMTLIGLSASIASLVFVLITYSLFTELRTPPGINLMNLSVSILLGQLLWLVGSGQTEKPILCTTIAILVHYFFVVSFVWTLIIAFDTWKAFSSKEIRSMNGSSLRYIALGWFSVLIYVGICVAIDSFKIINIGYQSSKICWMSNPSSIFYFFAVPVALILLLSVVFFCLTTKAIHVTESQARYARNAKDRQNKFGIYVRIASAMGFTWIFGFIAPFVGLDFFQFAFVFFNSLQGVYIAVAFLLNKRVLRLYKRLLLGYGKITSNNASS